MIYNYQNQLRKVINNFGKCFQSCQIPVLGTMHHKTEKRDAVHQTTSLYIIVRESQITLSNLKLSHQKSIYAQINHHTKSSL